jgi:hypothetical protein
MRFRTTLILLVILIALGVFVLFYERKLPAPGVTESTPWPTSLPPIAAFSPADARLVRLTRIASGEKVIFEKRADEQWYLTASLSELADQDEVSWFVSSLAQISPSRVIEEAGAASDYDLEPGMLRVEIELADGTEYTITLGAQTPSGSGYYGQVSGDASVYVLSYTLYSDAVGLLDTPPVAPTPMPTVDVPTATPAS